MKTESSPNRSRSTARGGGHAGPPLVVVASVFALLFVGSLVVEAVLSGGGHFPSPWAPEEEWTRYFAEQPLALRWGGALQFAASIPLGLYVASVTSRLRFLGVSASGAWIAQFGGLTASVALGISGLVHWTLGGVGPGAPPALLRALQLLTFGLGGPGHVAPLGLLVAGVAVTSGLYRLIPRGWMWFGLAIAAVAELSTLCLVVPALTPLLPLARFPALIWLVMVGARLPRSRRIA